MTSAPAREAALTAEVAAAHDIVKASGGLMVIGTERHESRRIDNQLRGRSGRQGDPGASRFFLSLEDDLMRIFGSERMGGMLQKLGLKPGEAIIHPWINRALEKAQKKVEARNFDTRKNVLKYDDVMNSQRREVYEQRREFMKAEEVSETVADMRAEVIDAMVARRIPAKAFSEQWESEGLQEDVRTILDIDVPVAAWAAEDGIDEEGLRDRIIAASDAHLAEKTAQFGPDLMRFIEKSVLLQTLDAVWKEHLLALDQLRQGIGLRAYGQRDPLNDYKTEAFALFNAMLDDLKERVTKTVAGLQLQAEMPPPPLPTMFENHPEAVLEGGSTAANVMVSMDPRDEVLVSDDPCLLGQHAAQTRYCPCGSGKKYKTLPTAGRNAPGPGGCQSNPFAGNHRPRAILVKVALP